MKQFVFLCALTLAGGIGGFAHPFWAVLLYYTLAVLRPQFLWDWALPMQVRWSLFAAVLALVMVVLHAHKLFKRGRFNATASLMLVYSLLILASVILAYDPGIAQQWATDFAKVIIMAMISTFVIEHLWQVRATAIMIGLCLGYVAYEINFNYFLQNFRLDVFHYGYGGLDNNGAGLMLAMGMPFAYCFALGRDLRLRVAAAVVGLMMVHTVMLTYSRGAMLAAAVGLLWLVWHHRPRWQTGILAPLLLAALLAMAGPEIRGEFLSMRQYQDDRSAQSRFDSWAAAWQITWEHPIFGAGVRNSNQYSHNYGADRFGRTIHNQYLQIAADSGVPAALVYGILVGTALWRLSTARRAALHHPAIQQDRHGETARELAEAGRLCLAVQGSLVIFATGAMFLSLETFELPWLILVLAGVLPGVVRRRMETLDDRDSQPQPQPKSRPARPRFTFAPPVPKHLAGEPSS